jgi:hypothetical protein
MTPDDINDDNYKSNEIQFNMAFGDVSEKYQSNRKNSDKEEPKVYEVRRDSLREK